MNWAEYQADLQRIWPEIILTVTVLLALVADLLLKGRDTRTTGWITLIGTLFTLLYVTRGYGDLSAGVVSDEPVFGLLRVDAFSLFMKMVLGVGLAVVILLSMTFKGFARDGIGEYYAILATAVLGGYFLVSTDHLLMLFLALETLSLSSYVLAGFLKKERRGAEAAMKYLVYGVLSSGAMLYGFSLLYGYTGSLSLPVIGEAVHQWMVPGEDGLGAPGAGLAVAFTLILAGFGYKIAAFPFHFWSPDVYEGAPTPVTTFLAVVSKSAAFAMVLRFFALVGVTQEGVMPVLGQLVALLAAASMTFGNLAAMLQDNAKRMLAYSSIAHSGYLLMGVAAMLTAASGDSVVTGPFSGGQAVLFYLFAYTIMNLGAFAVVLYLSNRFGTESIDGYRGLGWKAPMAGAMMTIFMLSLTGIPPTVGFLGKWYLFSAVISKGLLWLAVVAGVNSVISLFYYFRVIKALFLTAEEDAVVSPRAGTHSWTLIAVLVALGLLTVYFGLAFQGLSELVLEVAI